MPLQRGRAMMFFSLDLEGFTQAGRLRLTCYNGGSSDTLASTGHHYLADRDWPGQDGIL